MKRELWKAVYVAMVGIEGMFFIGGGAWLTYDSGSAWWLMGAVALVVLAGLGFAKRVDGWERDQ